MELEGSINIVYGILHHIFQILDTEDVPIKQIIPCLAILLQKSENDIANIIKKNRCNFVRKTKNYLKKPPNDLEKLHPDFSEEGKEERQLDMGFFLEKSSYQSIYFRKLFQF